MLPKENRLNKGADIENVKKKGKIFHSDNFKLLILNRDDQSPTRFAIIISSKISKNATLRNKSTRALRESLRRKTSSMKNGYDCVFIGRPGIQKAYTADLMKEVDKILEKSKLA